MDDFRIDSHKLIYHPRRTADWLDGKDISPLYIEISPGSYCNHRCIFCAFDYLGYQPRFIDPDVLKRFLKDIAAGGVKSVLFAGEGEALLYKQLPEMVKYAKGLGLDVAVTTNGALLTPEKARRILPYLTWLRVSLNAGTAQTYAKVHGTTAGQFDLVIGHLRAAAGIRRSLKSECAIGVQMLLLKENYAEAPKLAGILSTTGVDYFSIKPYSQHPKSINRLKRGLDYRKLLFVEKKVRGFERPDFKIIFRQHAMKRIVAGRSYKKCLGLPFASFLTAGGDLYACSAFNGDARFSYGNIYKQPFPKIWKGSKRRKIMRMMAHDWDISNCREACRLDEINQYLWQLKNDPPHVNFI